MTRARIAYRLRQRAQMYYDGACSPVLLVARVCLSTARDYAHAAAVVESRDYGEPPSRRDLDETTTKTGAAVGAILE